MRQHAYLPKCVHAVTPHLIARRLGQVIAALQKFDKLSPLWRSRYGLFRHMHL